MGLTWIDHDIIEVPVEEVEVAMLLCRLVLFYFYFENQQLCVLVPSTLYKSLAVRTIEIFSANFKKLLKVLLLSENMIALSNCKCEN